VLKQGSEEWMNARKIRITASKIHGIFTYRKNKTPDWRKKFQNTILSSFKGNAATLHGLKWERVARVTLETKIKAKIELTGLIVNPKLSWLG